MPGVHEKNVTLALAERVRALLEAPPPGDDPDVPRFHVLLCRADDRLVTIRARARCAAPSGARLFLSLHANATPSGVASGTERGFELYVLPPEDVEDDATLAALAAPPAAGVWGAHPVRATANDRVGRRASCDLRLRERSARGRARGVRRRARRSTFSAARALRLSSSRSGFWTTPPIARC